MRMMNLAWFGAACGVSLAVGFTACSSDAGGPLFAPVPECKGDSIVPLTGTSPQVISTLQIGSAADGFDLDHDGKPDNKLAQVAGIAKSSIDDAFKKFQIIIPIEFFDAPAAAVDSCVKFAIYLGKFPDKDGDGSSTTRDGGDCDDNDPNAYPGATEILDNGKDDNCNGVADEGGTDGAKDDDHDGQTIAQGDCNDHDATVGKGFPEVCGDGKDNDCDGVADRTNDANGNSTVCSPFAATAEIPLDPVSFRTDDPTKPVIAFDSGTITKAKDGTLQLEAGPSLFAVSIPITDGIELTLKITGATIKGDVMPEANGFSIKHGHLGGVIDAKTADTIRGLTVDQIGLTPENSLLDAMFANLLGPLLALPKANKKILATYPNCRTPDIDVDRDGLEAFCESDDTRMNHYVDICIDGDGTEVDDVVDSTGKTTMQCSEAQTAAGKDRFVDGVSVELNFETAPIAKIKPAQ